MGEDVVGRFLVAHGVVRSDKRFQLTSGAFVPERVADAQEKCRHAGGSRVHETNANGKAHQRVAEADAPEALLDGGAHKAKRGEIDG